MAQNPEPSVSESSPRTSSPPRGLHLGAPTRRWTWIAVAASLAIVGVIGRLHFAQSGMYLRTRQLLAEVRLARNELANGFRQVALSDNPRSSVRAEVALARLDRAIVALENSLTAARTGLPRPDLAEKVRLKVTGFRGSLESYRATGPAAGHDSELALFLAFEELDAKIQELDEFCWSDMETRRTVQEQHFFLTVVGSIALLGAMGVGIHFLNRREAAAVRALHASEGRLTETNQFLSDLIEHSATVITVKDLEGRYELVNRKWEEVTGIGRERALGRKDHELFPGVIGARYWENDRKVIETGQPVDVEEATSEVSGGRVFLSAKFPIRKVDGSIRGVCGVANEITEHKKIEATLHERLELQDKLTKTVATVPGVIFSFHLGSDGRMTVPFGTPGMEDLWGVPADDLRDDFAGAFNLIHDNDAAHVRARIEESGRTLQIWRDTFRINHPRKGERWLEGNSLPRREADGSVLWYGFVQDVTERKQMEERLRESERRYAMLFEKSTTPTVVLKLPEVVIVDANEAGEVLTGFTRKEMSGKTAVELGLTSKTTRQEATDRFREADSITGFETSLRTKGGDERFVVLRTSPIQIGGQAFAITTLQDVTERRKAEAALRHSEERLSFALRSGRIGAWSFNPRDRTATRTLIQARIFGYENTEGVWSFDKFLEHVIPEERDDVRGRVQQGMASQQDWEIECRIRRTDGELRWILITGGLESRHDGPLARVSGIVQDITVRKHAEEVLREGDLRRALALDAAKAGTWEWELATGKNIWSDELWPLYGLAPRSCEPSYEAWRESVHPDDRPQLEQSLQDSVRREMEVNLEWRVHGTPGDERWLMSRGRPFRDGAGRVVRYLGIVIDISERKRFEQQRAVMEAQQRHQQKLESIGTLASGVAHEINNPITGIMNYAELIQDQLPANSPLLEHTGEIKRETQRVATIVRNLLTFSRNEKQSHSPARVEDIVEAVLSLIRTVIRRDQIELSVAIPSDLPQLKCRSQQIQQVLMNLLTNARDALNERYTGHHPDKVLHLTASLFEKAGRRWIRITVEDHGTGISPAVRERMFDPFFTTKGRDAGTGLGLSISHGIVKEHHGEWTVESEPGQFTRMHVDLPVDNGWKH